ncbi:MAG: VanZ family protein [Candidatus Sumerlaeaceae bacterium]
MHALLPLAALGAMIVVIWYLGTGKFGRAQTQAIIDRMRNHPRLFTLLDRHHGKIRAAGHYFEFGGLFLVLYWLYDALWAHAQLRFDAVPAAIIATLCAIAALLDELHQLRSRTRQFRRVDFLHSCCGIALAALVLQYQGLCGGL